MSELLVLVFVLASIQSNCFHVVFGSADFFEIRKQPDFIDKTLMIRECFRNAESLVFAAPSGFGKSSNLDMIRNFVSNTVDRKQAEEVFRDTKISKEENFEKTHFNNYPVIYCSFKPDDPVSDYDSMVVAFGKILRQTFMQHPYLADSPHLTKYDLRELKAYTDMEKLAKLKPIQISVGLYFLSQILQRHHGKQVILLLDDYDNVILDSVFTKGLDVGEVLGFYNAILSGALLHNEHVNKTILAGTTCVSMKPLTDLEDLECVKFLQDDTFQPFFGLTEAEVDNLLGRENFKGLQSKRQDVKMWYNGYTSPDLSSQTYNTRSVLGFIKFGELRSYWSSTRGGNAFRVLLQERVTKQLLSESSQKVMIVVRHLTDIDRTHLEGLKKMIIHEVWDEDFSDLYVHLLMEKGYFTFDSPWERSGYNSSVTVKFPNLEVCEVVQQLIKIAVEEAKKQGTNTNIS